MASSTLGPSQIILNPGKIYDFEIIFARLRTVCRSPPRPPPGTFGDAVGGWGDPPRPTPGQANLPVFGASGAVSFEAFSVTSSLSGLKRGGRYYPGARIVTISLWRRFCFCRSLNHRNDWDPQPTQASHQAINHIVVDHHQRGMSPPSQRYSSSRGIIVHLHFQCLETWRGHFSENYQSISRKKYSDELSSSEG